MTNLRIYNFMHLQTFALNSVWGWEIPFLQIMKCKTWYEETDRGNKQKYDFFDDEDDKKDVKIKSDTEMDDIEAIPYVSLKRENDIDDREIITYAFPRRESEDEIDKKIYKTPKL